MDSIPSSPPNVNSPGIGNGSMDDRASGAGKLGEYSLSASLPDGNDEKKESIARLSALKAQQRPLEPPLLNRDSVLLPSPENHPIAYFTQSRRLARRL